MRLDSSRSPHVQSQTAGQSRGTRGRAWFKALAVPTAVATGLAVVPISTQAPVAQAQSSLPGSSNLPLKRNTRVPMGCQQAWKLIVWNTNRPATPSYT